MAADLETSLAKNPWRTLCNLFWGNRIAARPYVEGQGPIDFPSLWPDGRTFTELFQEAGMALACYDMVKLLLTSESMEPFEAMLEKGLINWEHRFPGGVTLMHLVCILHSEGAVNLMQKFQPENGLLTTQDSEGHDPLDVCFSPNFRKLIMGSKWSRNLGRWLSGKKKPLVNQLLPPEIQSAAFRLACSPDGLYSLARLLQEFTFDVNQERDADGNLLLHVAVSGGLACLPTVFMLIKQFKANPLLANEQGLNPLCLAAELGEEKLAEVLVCVFQVPVDSPNTVTGWTPLHHTAFKDHLHVARMLLERGADPGREDFNKCDAVTLAQKYRSHDCLVMIEQSMRERARSLSVLAANGTLDVASLFPSDFYQLCEEGFTLLMKAVLGNQPAIVRALVNSKHCDVNFRQIKMPQAVDFYTESLSSNPVDLSKQSLKTALCLAAENGLAECVRILLDAGADPAIPDSMQQLPLHYACLAGHKECVKVILDHHLSGLRGLRLATHYIQEVPGQHVMLRLLQEASRKRQRELVAPQLFEAAVTGDCSKLYEIIDDGDDVNPLNESSDWPLLLAAGYGHLEMVKMLYEHGGHLVQTHRLNLCTPLHTAARGGHVEVVRYLLQFTRPKNAGLSCNPLHSYLDVNARNASGATALELAVCHGHMAVTRLLLDFGAAATLPDASGRLLCSPAFSGVQFLLDSRRSEQMSEMSAALRQQKPLKEFKLLWRGPSDFNIRDSRGDTVLMVAARFAKRDVVDFLLQEAAMFSSDMKITWTAGSSPPTYPHGGSSPDDCYASDVPVHEYRKRTRSIDNLYRPASALGSRISERHRRRHSSRMSLYPPTGSSGDDEGSAEFASRVLAPELGEGQSQNCFGKCTQSGVVSLTSLRDGCTALHRAVEGNQHKIIPMLLSNDPLVADMQDHNGQTALHFACRSVSGKCINSLLKGHVDASVRDLSDNLAEDLALRPKLRNKVRKYRQEQQVALAKQQPTSPPFQLNPPRIPLPPRGMEAMEADRYSMTPDRISLHGGYMPPRASPAPRRYHSMGQLPKSGRSQRLVRSRRASPRQSAWTSSDESDVNVVSGRTGVSRLPTIKDSMSSLTLHEDSPAQSHSSLHEHVAELRHTAPFESEENSDS